MDFIEIDCLQVKNKEYDIKPVFCNKPSRDIIIHDGKFIAIWDNDASIWKTSKDDVVRLIDEETMTYYKKKVKFGDLGSTYHPKMMVKNSTRLYKEFTDWVKAKEDTCKGKILNSKVKFNNDTIKRSDYCSFKLPYAIEDGPRDAYNEIVETLYEPEEIEKIEWAIGSVIAGDSITIQKAIALYGSPGTGKSTILDIIKKMFTDSVNGNSYVGSISTKDLSRKNDNFGAAPLKENKLILIDGDANLSETEDNSVLNKIISHDATRANTKFGSDSYVKPIGMLFLATNYYINMSDAKTGLKRRVLIAKPTGNKIEYNHFQKLMRNVDNELGSIAYHCREVYQSLGKDAYDDWEPIEMFEFSNPIFSWISEEWQYILSKDPRYSEGIGLNDAWIHFKKYCEESGFKCGKKSDFKIDMIEYFVVKENYYHNGQKDRYFFTKLKEHNNHVKPKVINITDKKKESWLDMTVQHSILDDILQDEPAQYSKTLRDGQAIPFSAWDKCKTKLKDIDTSKLHYVNIQDTHHIVIDFDIKNDSGEKSFELNKEVAKDWPETYAELSKSGNGIHLHYIYEGDPDLLSSIFDKNVEIKVFRGDSSLRRKLTKCNNLKIARLPKDYLPMRKERKVYNEETFKSEESLRRFIQSCIKKEHHGSTAPEINFIKKALDDMYESGKPYDVKNMKPIIVQFAANSTNQSEKCLKIVSEMKFASEDCEEHSFDAPIDITEEAPIVFVDIECFPNLFLINWKFEGEGKKIVRMINPTPEEVKALFQYRLVGFNNRDYDNHMIWAASEGYSNRQLYNLSKKLINKDKTISREAKFMQAYGLSYTDIYDYAKKKQSLKKWEIELGIHHQELGLDWDSPVPENLWPKVAEYCDNDVIATEAVWNATQGDFLARKILAEIAGGKPNDKTNKLSAMFIFEGNKHPQAEFEYRFMGKPEEGQENLDIWDDGITAFQPNGKPVFMGYKFERGKSSYLDVEEVGEGGYVFAEEREVINDKGKPEIQVGGMYDDVWTFDVASQHPSSIIAENLFGDYYTARFKEILELRIAIKHGELDRAKQMFGGALAKYLDNPEMADALAGALKIVINSVYGLTSAKFENEFKDPRNIDNIVAKRGALFMINLRNLVQKMGYTVVHCKTDSIKVAHPDEKIKKFITDYGKEFGYNFEVEHIFEKICLVNNAVYIAKLSKDDPEWIKDCEKAKAKGKPEPTRWTATGTQFQVPYVFKSLFSGEDIEFSDMCETKSVSDGGLIYLDFDETLPDVSEYERILQTRKAIANDKKVTLKAKHEAEEYADISDSQLKSKVAKGHDYRFVGKVGLFCPVKDGYGGAIMYRYDSENDKYSAVTGTKDYRWIEAEVVRDANLEEYIDKSYYNALLDDAVRTISKYGDYEWFVA